MSTADEVFEKGIAESSRCYFSEPSISFTFPKPVCFLKLSQKEIVSYILITFLDLYRFLKCQTVLEPSCNYLISYIRAPPVLRPKNPDCELANRMFPRCVLLWSGTFLWKLWGQAGITDRGGIFLVVALRAFCVVRYWKLLALTPHWRLRSCVHMAIIFCLIFPFVENRYQWKTSLVNPQLQR